MLRIAGLLIAALLLFPGTDPAKSQEAENFTGQVVDAQTGRAIEYAHILNYSIRRATYSNSKGLFRLPVKPGDTIVFSALGYYYSKLEWSDTLLTDKGTFTIRVLPLVYSIGEARIIALGTYEDFRQQVLALNRPATATEKLAENLAESALPAAREAYQKAMTDRRLDGVTLLSVPILSPEEKERIVLSKIVRKQRIHDQIFLKFNPAVVKKVTGMTDEDEVIAFMVFCNFSEDYLLEVSEYDLMVRIAVKFELFRQIKKQKESENNPVNLYFALPFEFEYS